MSVSIQARIAHRMLLAASELYTHAPRRAHVRGKLQKLGIDPGPVIRTVDSMRRLLENGAGMLTRPTTPPKPLTIRGVSCYIFNPGGAPKTMVYFHGGAYYGGSVKTHSALCTSLARATNSQLIFVDYRLGPEHKHPAALEDAVAVVLNLYRDGFDPADIILAGDSAGGNLVLTTTLKLIEQEEPLPAACVCLSPWTDTHNSGESMYTNHETDAMLCKADIDWMRDFYTLPADYDDPFLSPLLADHSLLANLPPILIQASGSEVLLDDSRRFAAKAEAAGAQVSLEIWEQLPHVWHTYTGLIPEADQAIEGIAEWLASNTVSANRLRKK